jgi:hypothetical protein
LSRIRLLFIRLLLATFALVGTAFAGGLSPVFAQEIVVDEGEDQEVVVEEEEDQEEAAPDAALAPAVVVLFDAEGNPYSCSSVDTNADGVSELVCVPLTATDDIATVEPDTDDTSTVETDTDDTATDEDEEEADEDENEDDDDDDDDDDDLDLDDDDDE